jgi:hypothetical protein
MARERTDKVKKKPPKEKVGGEKSDAAMSTGAQEFEQTVGESPTGERSLRPTVGSKRRRERVQEGSFDDVEASETSLVQEPAASNGSVGMEGESGATHRRIAERAYVLFQESGYEHGNDWSHWFQAERQIKDTQM